MPAGAPAAQEYPPRGSDCDPGTQAEGNDRRRVKVGEEGVGLRERIERKEGDVYARKYGGRGREEGRGGRACRITDSRWTNG